MTPTKLAVWYKRITYHFNIVAIVPSQDTMQREKRNSNTEPSSTDPESEEIMKGNKVGRETVAPSLNVHIENMRLVIRLSGQKPPFVLSGRQFIRPC
jgi:hypothetical protein